MRLPLQSRIVSDPDGVRWRVSVVWTPWWPRQRLSSTSSDAASDALWWTPDVPVDVDLEGCAVLFLVIFLVIVLIAVLPFVLFAFEVALLIVVGVPLAILLGMLGLARWRIEVEREGATGDEKRFLLERHRGFLTADAAIHNLAVRIQAGDLRPGDPRWNTR